MIKNAKKSNEDITEENTAAEESKAKEEKPAEEKAEENTSFEQTAEEKKEADETADTKSKELEALNDKYLRLLAEYDNFKKRTVKEKEAIYIDSVGDTVTALLPIIDNFERAIASFSDSDKESDFYKGIEMIYNQTVEAFAKLGVKTIEALGCEFDPALHNAVMHIDDENAADNVVVEEFQKGYTYRDKVIRYSMVKVAN